MTREEKIRQVVQKYIATDKHNGVGVRTQAFIDGAEWADSHPASPWHSVADGDLPLPHHYDKLLIASDGKDWWVDRYNPIGGWASQGEVTHWMEIPKLPK